MEVISDHPNVTNDAILLARRLAANWHKVGGEVYESLAYRPVTTIFDAAVALSPYLLRTPGSPVQSERLLVWEACPPKSPHLSKLGGEPFCPKGFEWPQTESGPALFLGQLYLSYELQDETHRLPGDLLLLFDRAQSKPIFEKTSQVSIGAHNVQMVWVDVRRTYAGERLSRQDGEQFLPFEFSGSVIDVPQWISLSPDHKWFTSRVLNADFCSSEYWSEPGLMADAFSGFRVFAQLASLDMRYERSAFFSSGRLPTAQWPAAYGGPVTFGDLGSHVFFQSLEDRGQIRCEFIP